MKVRKKIMKIFIEIMLVIVFLLVISYGNHKFKLKKEAMLFKPLGEIVEVNGNKMSVFKEGEGKETLVFMSGGGTCSPILDFKSLYSRLSDDYQVVVIEKLGYGFSDVVDEKRDIETILSESREALRIAKVEGPYVLCPHSMSGIEAIYWASQYPEEVKSIVSLDMAVPDAYMALKINKPLLKVSSWAANIGLTRFIPGIYEGDAIKYGSLSSEEAEIYKAVFFRRTLTKNMIKEVEEVKANAEIVKEYESLAIPILMFSSNGEGTGFKEKNWRKMQSDYADLNYRSKLINLGCSHYVHDHEEEKIAEEIKSFLAEIN